MTAHEKDCSGEYVNKSYGLLDKIIGKLFQVGLKNSHQIIAQSKEQQRLLRETFQKDSTVMASSYPIPKLKKVVKNSILWVARAVEWKRPELFIEVARQLPNYQFVMVCPKDLKPEYYKQIKEIASKQGNLEFFDQIPFRKIDRFFREARIFVNTSTYEGFPNTFVQAAMNRTPIASLHVNPDDFLNEYQCGFCSHGDLRGLVSWIKRLSEDQSLYNQFSANAYRYAKHQHDIKNNVLKLKDNLYNLVLN